MLTAKATGTGPVLTLMFGFLISCQAAVMTDGGAGSGNRKSLTVLCVGDSITAGGYPAKLQEILTAAGLPANVLNAGMSGYTSGHYLRFVERFDLFRETNPDIIILQLGTNDARTEMQTGRFTGDLEKLIQIFKEDIYADQEPVLLLSTVPPIRTDTGIPAAMAGRVADINARITELAEKYSLRLVDNYALFEKRLAWLEDGIHPNDKGYTMMAENYAEIIKRVWTSENRKNAATGLVYDQRYLLHDPGPGHPESPARLAAIMDELKRHGLLSRLYLIEPQAADLQWIEKIHDHEYVQAVKAAGRSGREVPAALDTIVTEAAYETARLAAGGVLAAVDAVVTGTVRNAFCAVRPPGHHAKPGAAAGFCFFNNVAIGVRYIQEYWNLDKVLVIDWDVHHGDGTQEAFYADPGVLFFSVHQYPFYPGTGKEHEKGEGDGYGFNINVPLAATSGDREYIDIFNSILKPAALAFDPDFILISAGFDAHEDDRLGNMNLTLNGFAEMTAIVMDLAEQTCSGRIVSILEGGYGPGLGPAVVTHLKALSNPLPVEVSDDGGNVNGGM